MVHMGDNNGAERRSTLIEWRPVTLLGNGTAFPSRFALLTDSGMMVHHSTWTVALAAIEPGAPYVRLARVNHSGCDELDEICVESVAELYNPLAVVAPPVSVTAVDSDDEAVEKMPEAIKPVAPKGMGDDGGSSTSSFPDSGDDEPEVQSSDDGDDHVPIPIEPVVPSFPTHSPPNVETKRMRNGKQIEYLGHAVGTITMWSRGISCKCRLHGKVCNTPL